MQNRVEAGGTAGAAAVARAAPDGHTLLVVDDRHTVNPHLFRNLDYDALGGFRAGLAARARAARSRREFARAREIGDGSSRSSRKRNPVSSRSPRRDPASPARLLMEMLKLDAGVSVTSVPYEDVAQALARVAGGGTDAIFTTLPGAAEHLKSGRVRALAVTSEAPSAALPGVPLMKDAYPAFVAYFWVGMLAPAKTPPAYRRAAECRRRQGAALGRAEDAARRPGTRDGRQHAGGIRAAA